MLKSFEKEEDAYCELGDYLFIERQQIDIIMDSLIFDYGQFPDVCKENIPDFESLFQKNMTYTKFNEVFSPIFAKCIPIIKATIEDNDGGCDNYSAFGVREV